MHVNAMLYFAPDAVGAPERYFFDGLYVYERVHVGGLGSLGGWLKRIGKKIKKKAKRIHRKVKKHVKRHVRKVVSIHKKAHKIARRHMKKVGKKLKKFGKKALKVVHKALPIVNTVLSFVPGVGWVAKAALTAAEIGLNAYYKHKNKKAAKKALKKLQAKKRAAMQKQMHELNSKKTTPVKAVNKVNAAQLPKPRVVYRTVYTPNDYLKIHNAVTGSKPTPAQVAAYIKHNSYKQLLQTIL